MVRVPRLMCVAGARPNFMKIAPVLAVVEARGATTSFVHTGQHYDQSMSDVFFDDLGLRRPDVYLGVGSGSHAEQTGAVMQALEPIVADWAPDAVVVVGDVNSTLGAALVAAKSGALVAHVEAGLRSRDWEMPEEINRVVVDRVSDLLFAPSDEAVVNLHGEGYRGDQVHLVGNVMADSLLQGLARARERPIHQRIGIERGSYALVTLHRPANVDHPVVLAGVLAALAELAAEIPVVFPAHPRVAKRLGEFPERPGVHVLDPLGYLDFLALEADARMVFTDSGGVQEETTILGVPCLTLRGNTERPVTIEQGTNRLVGTDPQSIVEAGLAAATTPRVGRRPPLWDGRASGRIADVLIPAAQERQFRLRPTELG